MVRIKVAEIDIECTLNDTDTAIKLLDVLPITASTSTWGDEIYFSIPVSDNEDNSKEVVELGDLGYWPPGNAFCIFFGLTPASSEGEIRPASPVNILGKIIGELDSLKQVKPGESVIISRKD